MKAILLTLCLFFCFNAEAQNANKPVLCGKAEDMKESVEKLGEKVIWISPSPAEKSEYVFFGNKETGAWSLVQVVDGVGCLVAFGEAPKVKGDL